MNRPEDDVHQLSTGEGDQVTGIPGVTRSPTKLEEAASSPTEEHGAEGYLKGPTHADEALHSALVSETKSVCSLPLEKNGNVEYILAWSKKSTNFIFKNNYTIF